MVSNFIFTSLAGRFMGPENYGVFMSFFYFLLGLSQPNTSLQLSAAKHAALSKSPGAADSIKELSSDFWVTGIVLFCLVLALYPLIKYIYGLKNPVDAFIGAAISALWLVTAGYRGVYQGRMDFLTLGMNTGLEGVVRALAGILLIIAGWKVTGALGASIIGSMAAIFLLIRKGGPALKGRFSYKINYKFILTFLSTCLVFIPFGLINALDLTLENFVIGGAATGYLSACALFGKNLITLSLFLSGVVYSYSLKSEKGHFWTGIVLTAVSFAIPALFTLFFGKWLVVLIFGNDYMPVVGLLPIYIMASMPLGIMLNIINYSVARNIKALFPAMWILLAALAGIYYIALKNLRIDQFLIFITGVLVLADLILMAVVFLFRQSKMQFSAIEDPAGGLKK